MISASLGSSRKFHALLGNAGSLGEFAQILFPLLVVNADDFGRIEGDAFTVRHKVYPTSPRSEEDFDMALTALAKTKLIERYEADGDLFIQIVQFDEHQTGLHKRTKSRFPEIPGNSRKKPPDSLSDDSKGELGNSRKFPEIPPELNGTKQKGREEKPPNGGKRPNLWDVGIGILVEAGDSEQKARTFLGSLTRDYGKSAMAEAVAKLSSTGPIAEPHAYLKKLLKNVKTGGQVVNEFTDENRKLWEKAHGSGRTDTPSD